MKTNITLYASDYLPKKDDSKHIYADQEQGIFILVHGPHEDSKSQLLISTILQISSARLSRVTGTIEERIREAITLANNEVYSILQTSGIDYEPAIMITAIVINGVEAMIGQVGDSQLYKVAPNAVQKLTKVITTSNHLKNSDEHSEPADSHLTAECEFGLMEREPEDEDFIKIRNIDFESDTALLLCSNSLSTVMSDTDIFNIIKTHPGNRTRVIRALLSDAHKKNSNPISVLFIEGSHFARALRHTTASTENLSSQ